MADARGQAQAAARDEYLRLLYVAMTRAKERLVICGTQGERKIPDGCWYQRVDDELRDDCVREPADDGDGEVLRFRKGAAPEQYKQREPALAPAGSSSVPRWLTVDASPARTAVRTITPSSVMVDEGRRAPTGGAAQALLRGSLAHRLLQSLPDISADRRRKAADDYLVQAGGKLPPEERVRLAEQVMLVLDDARFHKLFTSGSRAEVPIVGNLSLDGETVRVSGQVDRLSVTQTAVLIADFKTNRPAPWKITDVPPAYIHQLALYRAVLQKLYPDRLVSAALIWTEVPDLMELSAQVLDGALAQVTSP
jgi:ATP-dependent helicase/nuclease subunit A